MTSRRARPSTGGEVRIGPGSPSPALWRGVVAATGRPGSRAALGRVAVVDVTRPSSLALQHTDDEAGTPLVVLYRPAGEHEVRVAASVLVGQRPHNPVALVPTTHAPLAAVLTLATALDVADDAGHGVAALRDLHAASWSAVVTSSVASLDDPAPTVAQHVRSWWPRSRFLVRLGARPRIVSAASPLLAMDGVPAHGRVLHTTAGRADDPVTAALASRTPSEPALGTTLPDWLPPALSRADGDQFVLMPAVPEDVVGRPGPPCRTCGLSVSGRVCDFCRTVQRVHVPDTPRGAPAGSLV